jgi:hypothetical protein
MTTKLLPNTKFTASKKTISADSITSINKNSSTTEKLDGIRKFLLMGYKRNVSSFIMKRRERQDEKRKLREENLEKKKESKFSLPSVNIANPLEDIFSSIGNFLLFLGGGLLFNKFFDLEKGLMGVAKILPAIGKGIEFIANVVGAVTNFIDSSVKGYDNFMKSFEDITGVKKEDVETFLEKFKFVINGAVIAAMITLRSLPGILTRRLIKGKTPKIKKPIITQSGQSRNIFRSRPTVTSSGLSGKFARSAITNTTRRGIVAVLGKSGTKSLLQFSKRFISPILKGIPIIGAIVDFLLNYFVFKEPLGRAAFKAMGAGLFGALGAAMGGPFAVFTTVGGAMLGDWAGGKFADVILGDKDTDVSGIDSSAEYEQLLEYNNTLIQPIVIS